MRHNIHNFSVAINFFLLFRLMDIPPHFIKNIQGWLVYFSKLMLCMVVELSMQLFGDKFFRINLRHIKRFYDV